MFGRIYNGAIAYDQFYSITLVLFLLTTSHIKSFHL